MGISERKAREREELRARILQAAEEVFLEEGYDKAQIRRIADKVEYSPGTVYSYFKQGKDELFYEIHSRQMTRMYQAMMTHLAEIEHPVARLRAFGRAYVQYAVDHPLEYDLMFVSRVPMTMIHPDETWTDVENLFGLFQQVVTACINGGYFPQAKSLPHTLMSLWSMVHGAVTLLDRERLKMFPEEGMPDFILSCADHYIDMLAVSP
jgi:AcrR family transcriptional regulator